MKYYCGGMCKFAPMLMDDRCAIMYVGSRQGTPFMCIRVGGRRADRETTYICTYTSGADAENPVREPTGKTTYVHTRREPTGTMTYTSGADRDNNLYKRTRRAPTGEILYTSGADGASETICVGLDP